MSLGRKDTARTAAAAVGDPSAVCGRISGRKRDFCRKAGKLNPASPVSSALHGENSLRGSFAQTALFYSQRGATRQLDAQFTWPRVM